MNKNAIDISIVPIGTKYVGIDPICEEETLVKVSEDEICWGRKCNGKETFDVYKILKHGNDKDSYYYFNTKNGSFIPITTKYYRQEC